MISSLIGFIASIALTLAAYAVGSTSIGLVSLLATLQMLVQFVFFLHLGQSTPVSREAVAEEGSRWNALFFVFTLLIALCVVLGSIWIMYNLNYRM